MAGDRRQFEQALGNWYDLHLDHAYSVPYGVGKIAIFVSYLKDFVSDEETDLNDFTTEAYQLADKYEEVGHAAEVIVDAKGEDMTSVLRDPGYDSIITIGHGALSYLYIENGVGDYIENKVRKQRLNNRFDWLDVSYEADHLKQGVFIQRHCGNASRRLSVPLGSFAMTEHDNVFATANNGFMPSQLLDPALQRIPVTSPLSYESVQQAFSNKEFLEGRAAAEANA